MHCCSNVPLPWEKQCLSSYIFDDLVFSVMSTYYQNLLMLFDLAFQMKCIYNAMYVSIIIEVATCCTSKWTWDVFVYISYLREHVCFK